MLAVVPLVRTPFRRILLAYVLQRLYELLLAGRARQLAFVEWQRRVERTVWSVTAVVVCRCMLPFFTLGLSPHARQGCEVRSFIFSVPWLLTRVRVVANVRIVCRCLLRRAPIAERGCRQHPHRVMLRTLLLLLQLSLYRHQLFQLLPEQRPLNLRKLVHYGMLLVSSMWRVRQLVPHHPKPQHMSVIM